MARQGRMRYVLPRKVFRDVDECPDFPISCEGVTEQCICLCRMADWLGDDGFIVFWPQRSFLFTAR